MDLNVVNYYLVCNDTCQPNPYRQVRTSSIPASIHTPLTPSFCPSLFINLCVPSLPLTHSLPHPIVLLTFSNSLHLRLTLPPSFHKSTLTLSLSLSLSLSTPSLLSQEIMRATAAFELIDLLENDLKNYTSSSANSTTLQVNQLVSMINSFVLTLLYKNPGFV